MKNRSNFMGRLNFCRCLKFLALVMLVMALPREEALSSTEEKSSAVVIVQDGTAALKIYVDPSDWNVRTKVSFPVREVAFVSSAIEDLNYHMETMCGERLEIVKESDPTKIPPVALVVGSLAGRLGCEVKESRWNEGFRILAKGGRILISGESPMAISYGVYTLLSRLGCDWVMPGRLGEIIPQKEDVAVTEMDVQESPAFGMRELWYRGGIALVEPNELAEFELWKRRQRLGVAEELCSNGMGHEWNYIIDRHKEEFEKNPEMLALVRQRDGKLVRKGPQLEVANPRLIALVADDIRAKFKAEGWQKDKKVTLPIGPADGDGFSVSPEAQALGSGRKDVIMGGEDSTDQVVKLANDVLEILEPEYPNLSLAFYVYSVHADYPSKQPVHPKIFPIFAPISYSRLQSSTDASSKTRAYYRGILDRWSETARKHGNRMLVHDYNWNFADNMLPFTRIKTVADDLRMYHELGFSGLIVEATKAWSVNGPHDYIYAKMSWDPSLDWKVILAEYCREAFGPAAADMERYYRRLVERQSLSGQEAGSYFSAPAVFNAEYVAAARKDISSAMSRDLSAEQRERLEAAVFPFSTLEEYLAWDKAIKLFDFSKALKPCDAILDGWKNLLDRNPQFVAREVPGYLKSFIVDPTKEAEKLSSAPYRIVFRFPDQLATCLDPHDQGERLNLASVHINDEDWLKTRTYGSTWDAQGLGLYRQGSVWYRLKFSLPIRAGNERVGLFLGGFEDEARVWINGEFIGGSGIQFCSPAVFDLTASAQFGRKNVLTVQIRRNSQINEIGLGGILRPSFVFLGPAVDGESKTAPEFRVLPGGEREQIKSSKAGGQK